MRVVPFIISTVLTILLIIALNNKWGSVPPLGKFLSPQQGFWQNAEPADLDYNKKFTLPGITGTATVYFDDRLVPHVFADNEADAYFVQGYLHARFRLWQMDFQTMAAAGRISEIIGNNPKAIRFDREQRRLGMVYGAENAVKAMQSAPETQSAVEAYTAGVNTYIHSLSASELPFEYKLLDYQPEAWSQLKIGLFLMQMSKELAGFERDIEFTNAKSVFSQQEMEVLYPTFSDSSIPIVPDSASFTAGIAPTPPASADSLYFRHDTTIKAAEQNKPNRANGSNSWAVGPQKTRSGAPILCNDPHLGLTLPSIWYEMQLTTPTMHAYGATFPGAPCIIIGFNDSVAFGVTNAMRDVKDYYQIRFKDTTQNAYWFDGEWRPAQQRVEEIKVRGAATIYDTVAYTLFGPVMYDRRFTTDDTTSTTALAVKWAAHQSTNVLMTFYKLDRAKNYSDYLAAIKYYSGPGQNFTFASHAGDIAIWQQARFPAYWKGQGWYTMPGEDSSYLWKKMIPQSQNPHVINPSSGFVVSANQRPVDTAYPYFIPGNYITPRGITIAKNLAAMQQVTPQDMMQLQNNVFDQFAASAVPLLLKNIDANALNGQQNDFLTTVKQWDYKDMATARAPTIFYAWWAALDTVIWKDEFDRVPYKSVYPDDETLLELLLKDSTLPYVDDINTTQAETLPQQVTAAFIKASALLQDQQQGDGIVWWKHKNATIYHLLRDALPSFARSGLEVGGWKTTINALTHDHGPSWRMIVQLTTPVAAYGVFPGGQNGNPGSRFYDNFIDTWATGHYYQLWLMNEKEQHDTRVKWKMVFTHS